MDTVNSQNITEIISYLYSKRLNQTASAEVLDSWSSLSDEEAKMHLHQLFTTWGYDQNQIDAELSYFFQEKNNQQVAVENEMMPSYNSNYSSSASAQSDYSYNAALEASKARKSNSWIWILLLPILAAGGYLIYKFQQFKNLHYLYVTTDNVSIRDVDGKLIGRMDMFESPNSVSYLRTTGLKTYPIKVDENMYQCRQVVFDSTTFSDYLFSKPEAFGYVNENYVIDDKESFLTYRNIFKAVNNIKKENSTLTSAYRKVIVGSVRLNPSLQNLYIQVPCIGTDKSQTGILKWNKGDHYQVVAMLSDGKYYIFSGDPSTQSFEAPRPFNFKVPNQSIMQQFNGEGLLFSFVNGTYFLFYCDASTRDYYILLDSNGNIQYAKNSFEP